MRVPPSTRFAAENASGGGCSLRGYILDNVDRAVRDGWIQVYYQPVVMGMSRTLCGAEALARWIDPERGMLAPAEFIPVLEESGKIYEFDLYIVEQICKDYHRVTAADVDLVPVSFNLSRVDFQHPDLFERIEELVQRYEVPRDKLNVEVTESAFVADMELLGQTLSAFRRGGYEIWMDDFGSGYSSLGVLKDYTFDEIKIDMSFLSSSSEKSRIIIESTVRMAKAIGVRTLAEGVETEEQYQFLRSIGCEKVQGYLFGKPMPGKLVSRFCREQGIATVTSRWRNYYIALGRIDYLTDEPLAVVEDDGRTLKILFANERIRDIYSRDGVTDLHDWERRLNAHGSPVHSLHRDFVDNQLHEVGDTQTLTYPSGGHYMLLTAQVVARCENRSIYRASLQYVQIDAEEENQRRADMLRNLFYVFRDVALIDFSDDSVEGLKSSLSDQPIGKVARVKGVQLVFDTWTTEFVYPEDRARFRDFARADTFVQRLKRSAGGMLHGYFRSKNVDGSYTWLHHVVICVPRTNFEQLVYATVETGMDLVAFYRVITGERGGAAELAGSFAANAASEITDHALWRSLIEGSFVKYFWKDRQRRFLGVSQKFLEFYGLDSERDVLGKTDEEMGWHIDAEPFMQDELDVIERGKVIKNVKGRCVVRGRVHDIIVNKVPVYRDGKIVGLIGHFIDAEDLEKSDGDAMRFLVEDPVTGVANTRGFIEGLSGYLEELWSGGVRFAVMSVFVRGYDEFIKVYGRKAGDVLLAVVADALRGVFSTHAVIGRFANGQFFVLQQYESEQEVHDSAELVRSSVRGIHRAGEWPCTCAAVVNVHLAKGGAGSDRLFASMLTGLIDAMPKE